MPDFKPSALVREGHLIASFSKQPSCVWILCIWYQILLNAPVIYMADVWDEVSVKECSCGIDSNSSNAPDNYGTTENTMDKKTKMKLTTDVNP